MSPALVASVLATLLALLVPGAAPAQLPQQRGGVDLLSEANIRLEGAAADHQTGMDVANAGDVNGDKIDDIIVGAPKASENGRNESGSAYVVFGGETLRKVDLGSLGPNGIRIDGAEPGDEVGTSVGGAGDVNGDQLADVIVGAPQASPWGEYHAGISYVVFGRRDAGIVDLADYRQTRAAFALIGANESDESGQAVAGAGDIDSDNLDDLIVGAPKATGWLAGAGKAYVVFGRAAMGNAPSVDLGAIGVTQHGFEIRGAQADDAAGFAVASAGDLNGDRYGDVVVGAPHASNNSRSFSGSAYVVFGATRSDTVDLSNPFGNRWYRIDGEEIGDKAGTDVAGAEDANGDGHPDVVIGAPFADHNDRQISGSAYVLFCGVKPGEARDLRELGEHGYRIDGGTPGDRTATTVDFGGDVNGDELADVILGAPAASYGTRLNAGSAYAVYGKRSYGRPFIDPVDLARLGGGGFRMDGAAAEDGAGSGVAAAGDFNGDGRADVGVGAPYADDNGRQDSGTAYIVYGFGQPQLAYDPLIAQVGVQIVPHGPSRLRRTGQPTFTVSPPLPEGLELDSATGVVSGTPAAPSPDTRHTVTMVDLAGETKALLAVTVGDGGAHPGEPPGDSPSGFDALRRECPGGDASGRYGARLWAPREVPLADLAGRRGVRFDAWPSERATGDGRLTITGASARRLGLLDGRKPGEAKLLAQRGLELVPKPHTYRLRAPESVRRLLRRAMLHRALPATVRMKLVVESRPVADTNIRAQNALPIRARVRGTLRRGGNRNGAGGRYMTTCGPRRAATVGTPREVPYTLLVRRGGSPGPGIPVRASCDSACDVEIEVRVWGRFGETLGLWRRRQASRRDEDVVARRTLTLAAGESSDVALTVDDPKLRKRMAKPLADLRHAPKRVKAKVVLIATNADRETTRDAHTLRLRLHR